MANDSKIQWTDHTVNFWTGCKKVSDGCKFCYMYRGKEMYGKNPMLVTKTNPATIRKHMKNAKPGDKIFTCSWSDFFIEEADQWRDEAWGYIRSRPDLIWQILTKRPERIAQCLPADWGDGWQNVWIGVTVENQKAANERLRILDRVKANVKFVSFEPLLGPINLYDPALRHVTWDITYSEFGKDANLELCFDWAIIGGESGNNVGKYQFRPAELEWFSDLAFHLRDAEVPVFMKQLGTHLAKSYKLKDRHGGNMEEWPAVTKEIQSMEFPEIYAKTDLLIIDDAKAISFGTFLT